MEPIPTRTGSRGLAAVAAAGGLILGILAVASPGGARPVAHADVSSNWAGYVVTGLGSTSTTASSDMTYSDVTGLVITATNVAARVNRRSSFDRTAWDSVRAWPVGWRGAETVAIAE